MTRLSDKPIRKPLARWTTVFIFAVVLYCLYRYGDVPPGAVTVLMGLVAIPCAVVGSSSYEAVREHRRKEDERHEV